MANAEATAPPNGATAETPPPRSTAVAERTNPAGLMSMDPEKLAEHFVKSGFFKDASDLSKAVVKIVAGQEMGLGPMASMQGIHIIDGKPSMAANLLAAQVKRHPAYNYRPVSVTDQGAKIEFFEHGESIGTSEFTLQDAQTAGIAGKGNFKKYPKAMMFARALSQGVRWYCPDVTAGTPAYVPEELGAVVAESGEPKPTEAEAAEEVVEAEVVLDEGRVARIIGGVRALGSFTKLQMILGACGVDAVAENSADSIMERVRSLTEEQADKVSAELDKAVAAAEQDADVEQPQDGGKGDE